MLENQQNKMQKKDKVKEVELEQEYTFPDYGIVIKAVSLEEALKKLKALTIKKQ